MSDHAPLVRRSFLGRLTVGAAAFGAALTGGAALPSVARAASTGNGDGHPEDAWFDGMKGMHKVIYDCTSAENGHSGWFFAKNFLTANASGYNMKDTDCAVVVSVRHFATFYAYNDAMWAKYPLAEMGKIDDPATKARAKKNTHSTEAKELAARGVVLSVCGMATQFFAGEIAKQMNLKAEDVNKELAANLVVPQAHMMAAGVVAVSRAQEHKFTYTYVG